ncbi:DUF3392 domain-containing protein [Paraglaciecola polaris]|uniref:DUF3392 domain-containing protein n=1 Tax=Paraglaciecola polaris LMG 21857 TaxID=1129793 RepID=K7A905_9ALTE|nr:DUF3392 domain-containing protein [Paraglaciecola polaris]GAC31900.1 hypothetical protein GPLA_0984 [Paraglaciecola polaris LMG 21857]
MDLSIIFEGLASLTRWLSPYYAEISMTIVATVLVIYGDILNKKIKHILSPYHFIVRTSVFVVICAFGYGALVIFTTPHVKLVLMMIPSLYRGISVVSLFLLLGYLAEHRRYI